MKYTYSYQRGGEKIPSGEEFDTVSDALAAAKVYDRTHSDEPNVIVHAVPEEEAE